MKDLIKIFECEQSIKRLKREIVTLNHFSEENKEIIDKKNVELNRLLHRYKELSEGKEYYSIEDDAFEFIDGYYRLFNGIERDPLEIEKYYTNDSHFFTPPSSNLTLGSEDIVALKLRMFENLNISIEVTKLTASKEFDLNLFMNIFCSIKIKLNNDEPRKVLQVFDVKKLQRSSNPLVISKELFIVQDARPLFHWPETELKETEYDNWEPQFKPKDYDEQKRRAKEMLLEEKERKEKEAMGIKDVEEGQQEESIEENSLEEGEESIDGVDSIGIDDGSVNKEPIAGLDEASQLPENLNQNNLDSKSDINPNTSPQPVNGLELLESTDKEIDKDENKKIDTVLPQNSEDPLLQDPPLSADET